MFHRSMMRYVVTLGIGGLVSLAPAAASGQQLAEVFVEALDASGAVVPDLTLENFTVMEDAAEATVVSAELGDTPMKIALMVDHGARVAEVNATNPLRDGLNAFLETLPPPHEIALFSIARNIQRRVDFTADRDELKDGVGLVFAESGASVVLLDGIKETWERRFEEDDAFPVFVLVLTDGTEGSGNYNDDQYAELVDMLIRNGVTVHTVMLMTRGGNRGGTIITSYAENLSGNTGGLYENINTATGFTQALTGVATRMGEHFDTTVSKRYKVVYERPDPPGTSISVQLQNRGDVTMRLFANRRMQ